MVTGSQIGGNFMRKVILLLTFVLLFGFIISAQAVLHMKSPNLKGRIELLHSSLPVVDNVKFRMTVTNVSNSTQKVLFNKPFINYP